MIPGGKKNTYMRHQRRDGMFFSVRHCQARSASTAPQKFRSIVLRIHFLIVRLGHRPGPFSSFRTDPALALDPCFYPWWLGLLPAPLGAWSFFLPPSRSSFSLPRILPRPRFVWGLGASSVTSITDSSSKGLFLCFPSCLAFAFKLPSLSL